MAWMGSFSGRRRTRVSSWRVLYHGVSWTVAFVAAPAFPTPAQGQGGLSGRVLASDNRQPLAGAELRVGSLERPVFSNDAGEFHFAGIPGGTHLVVVRKVGYEPDSALIVFAERDVVQREFVLRRRPQDLPEMRVVSPERRVSANMAGFNERRTNGIGRFVDRATFEKNELGRTGDVLAGVPGFRLMRGSGNRAWAATGRAVGGGRAIQGNRALALDNADVAAGAKAACYMDVYLDGALVYTTTPTAPSPLFDLNSIPPSQIEAVELYMSASQVPAQYNRTSSGCGVMLIWTRM